jgi:tetratricopeptide (TPR) repeat protein
LALADSGRRADSQDRAARAAAQDPGIDSYALTAGLAAARAGNDADAAAWFEKVALVDDLPEAWLDLAAEQVVLGRTVEAIPSLEAALRVGRQRVGIAMAAGDLALQLGRTDIADGAFTAALRAWPLLAGDPWWQGDVDRATALTRAVTSVDGQGPDAIRWQLALAQGDADRARASSSAEPDRAFVDDVIAGWGTSGNATAARSAMDACLAQPQNLDRQLWCGRLAASRGDTEQAKRFATLAEFLIPGTASDAGLLRVTTATDTGAAGDLAIFWGNFTYRRFTPRDMLVPSLLQLVSE